MLLMMELTRRILMAKSYSESEATLTHAIRWENDMNAATNLLHDMRGQQLKALARIIGELKPEDADRVRRFTALSGQLYDTRNLSDKSLEEIDIMAGKYFQ